MTNEADLTAPLDSLGFEVVQLETMTVAEQQALLGSARVVVAEHGAALTNLIWCPAGAAVIEILPTTLPNPCFKILAEQRGLRYLPVFAPRRTRHRQDDWRIDADAIEAVLAAVRSL